MTNLDVVVGEMRVECGCDFDGVMLLRHVTQREKVHSEEFERFGVLAVVPRVKDHVRKVTQVLELEQQFHILLPPFPRQPRVVGNGLVVV